MTYPGLNPDWFGEIKMTLSKKVKHFIINETFKHFAANRQKQNFNSFNYQYLVDTTKFIKINENFNFIFVAYRLHSLLLVEFSISLKWNSMRMFIVGEKDQGKQS